MTTMPYTESKRATLERHLAIAQGELARVRVIGNRGRSTNEYHLLVGDLLSEISDVQTALRDLPLDGQIALPGVLK